MGRWKTPLVFLAGLIVGGFLVYGFMWWQVYQKFNNVWLCQVFTGELSIEEKQHCARLEKQPE